MDQLLINGGPIENSFDGLVRFMVVNATFSNISTISWRPVLVMEEAGVPGETVKQFQLPFLKCYGKVIFFVGRLKVNAWKQTHIVV
jgi:hypothetical protein